jgi:hypothetical protein
VFRGRGGRVFAVGGRCPHRDGPFADGMRIGERVVCPPHGFRLHGTAGARDRPCTCAIDAFPARVPELCAAARAPGRMRVVTRPDGHPGRPTRESRPRIRGFAR